jgi:hypothetical protein
MIAAKQAANLGVLAVWGGHKSMISQLSNPTGRANRPVVEQTPFPRILR